MNKGYLQLLVDLNEILTKNVFLYTPWTFGTNLYLFHTIYRLHFWSKFSSSYKVSRQ